MDDEKDEGEDDDDDDEADDEEDDDEDEDEADEDDEDNADEDDDDVVVVSVVGGEFVVETSEEEIGRNADVVGGIGGSAIAIFGAMKGR